MKNNKVLVILLSCMALFILVLLSSYIGIKIHSRAHMKGVIQTNPQNEEYIKTKHTMNYKNIDILKSLNGNMQVSTTCKKVEACIYTNLPTIYENVKSYNESQLSDYYKNNTSNIKSQLHIISEKSFINLINKAKEANCDLTNDYKSCEFMFIDNKINFKVNYNNGKTIEAQLVGDNSASIAFDF